MGLVKILSRCKPVGEATSDGPKLKRVLGLGDLTLLSVGSTLGIGVYVLAGQVARDEAGPAVTVSFLVAAIASAFAGLCYAEFAARVPKAGSAYVYSYVTVGEFIAFLIGWDLILEYIIGTASVARGLSDYLDSLLDKRMSEFLRNALPMDIPELSKYPDIFSAAMIMILSLLLVWGVKESSVLNIILTVVNLLTIVIVVIVGSFYIDFGNWNLSNSGPHNNTKDYDVDIGLCKNETQGSFGNGGFMPFGFTGLFAGAAKCFYGFIGFDSIATTGEEAKNPKRDIPLAIMLSLLIVFLVYFSISAVLTLMWPYYLQDPHAPLNYVFGQIGQPTVQYMVSGGAVFALFTSLFASQFSFPRILYCMASDGLLMKPFAYIHPTRQTPMVSTLIGSALAALLAAIFDITHLIDMMSIGTLLAYSIVAFSVVILRYRDSTSIPIEDTQIPNGKATIDFHYIQITVRNIFNLTNNKFPNRTSERISWWALMLYMVLALMFCITFKTVGPSLLSGSKWSLVTLIVPVVALMITVFIIHRQPQSQDKLHFKTPLLPWLPCVSILINIFLMVNLSLTTWTRFIVWLVLGLLVYVFYSIPNSFEGKKYRQNEARSLQMETNLK